jgi:hypothetical protein
MDTAAILEVVTGPFAALILSIGILYWLATKILPILQRYLEDQSSKLGDLVRALEKTVESHDADRQTFEAAISSLTRRLDVVEDSINDIKTKIM